MTSMVPRYEINKSDLDGVELSLLCVSNVRIGKALLEGVDTLTTFSDVEPVWVGEWAEVGVCISVHTSIYQPVAIVIHDCRVESSRVGSKGSGVEGKGRE